MMTSSNGNIFRLTGHFCGEFTGLRWIPAQRTVTRSFDVFFDPRLNQRLSKQSWGWRFETLPRSLWRHCNGKELDYDPDKTMHNDQGFPHICKTPSDQLQTIVTSACMLAISSAKWRHQNTHTRLNVPDIFFSLRGYRCLVSIYIPCLIFSPPKRIRSYQIFPVSPSSI